MGDDHAAIVRRGRGRPICLDPTRRRLFLAAIRAGNRVPVAATLAGLSAATVQEWIRRGDGRDHRPAKPFYRQFVDDVETARAEAEVYAVSVIWKAMAKDPRWAVWWLERTDPYWCQRRMPPQPVQGAVDPSPDTNPTMGVITISPEELRAMGLTRLLAQGSPAK